MSKLEMVRRLADTDQSHGQMQTLEQAKALQQATQQLRQTMDTLPAAVAQEVAQSLAQLDRVSSQVQQALTAFDLVNQTQRATLEATMQAMTEQSAAAFRGEAEALGRTVTTTAHKAESLAQAVTKMNTTVKQIEALPESIKTQRAALDKSTKALKEQAEALAEQTAEARARWWIPLAQTLGVGLLAGGVVLTGQLVFGRPAQLDAATQQAAAWGQAVWAKASPQEREWMQQIANRPAK